MRPEEIRFLYDDDRWATEKVLTALRDIRSGLRSEAAALLTDAGRSPGEIAIIFDVDALAGAVGGQAE